MRKPSDKSQLSVSLQNTWHLLKFVKVIKNKESLRDCRGQEEPKEAQQLIAMGYPG